ncbi:MAG: dUTP diphosphatase [Fimbriimonadaceae bacterium]|nr:MAG: dUTP diphosphatase [Fimbriimonadaceae bacterium]
MNETLAPEQIVVDLPVIVEGEGVAPSYASEEAAGMDLRSTEEIILKPLERTLAKTGLRMAIPKGFEGQIRPRSGLALKRGISMVNSPGTIDSDYRGEIGVILINLSDSVVQLEKGERIAQMVICPVARATVKIVDLLDETERGEGGFGSTGTK